MIMDRKSKLKKLIDNLKNEHDNLLEKSVHLRMLINQYIYMCGDGLERIGLEDEETNISSYHTALLKEQLKTMEHYLRILKARIDDLSKQFKECK